MITIFLKGLDKLSPNKYKINIIKWMKVVEGRPNIVDLITKSNNGPNFLMS